MKLSCRRPVFMMALVWCITAASSLANAAPLPKEKDKAKEHEGQLVDSGSFGVYQNGHRVGTETFSIYQTSGGSVIQSEFKTVNAPTDAAQTSEMQLTPNGEIRRYEWKELAPGKATSVVFPNSDFLSQKWRTAPDEKEQEQPYLLPASTNILDDYFFVHRELLAWKFLAAACKQEKGTTQCPLKQRTQFGTLNPHQHASAPLGAEFLGREKVTLKNGERDLFKLEFKTEAGTWHLWLDDQDHFKVMRMSVVGENTAVERD